VFSEASSGDTADASGTLWADELVTVSGQAVETVVEARHGFRISGSLKFDGKALPPPPDVILRMGVGLLPIEGRMSSLMARAPLPSNVSYLLPGLMALSTPLAGLTSTGAFSTAEVPAGRYFMTVPRPDDVWSVDSIVVGGSSAPDGVVDLGTAHASGVVIKFTDDGASLSGQVQSTIGSPAAGASVLVFPVDYRQWISNGMTSFRRRLANANREGMFSVRGIPPGDYLVVAIDGKRSVDVSDPSVFESLAPRAKHVSLRSGTTEIGAITLVGLR
jgi:hypothetical protein